MTELRIDRLFEALSGGGVEFIVIGGVAVGWHGYVRATNDLDVVPEPSTENLRRLASVLRAIEAEIEGSDEFAEQELPDPLDPDTLALGGNWVLSTKHGFLDVLQGLGERELWDWIAPHAVEDVIAGQRVRVCGYDELVQLKREADRPRDREDLDALEAARRKG